MGESIFEYMTKNRKLKLEEYDETGNLIDVREFDNEAMYNFMHYQVNFNNALSVARKADLEIFTNDQLNIIQQIITYTKLQCAYGNNSDEIYWFTEKEVTFFKELFNKLSIETIGMAINLMNGCQPAFNTSLKSEYALKKFSFKEALKFIQNREGIYYTVNNNGKRIYDFVDKPTKKQVVYQRKKNGNRTVFLSFKDWKEYIIDENEIK